MGRRIPVGRIPPLLRTRWLKFGQIPIEKKTLGFKWKHALVPMRKGAQSNSEPRRFMIMKGTCTIPANPIMIITDIYDPRSNLFTTNPTEFALETARVANPTGNSAAKRNKRG